MLLLTRVNDICTVDRYTQGGSHVMCLSFLIQGPDHWKQTK